MYAKYNPDESEGNFLCVCSSYPSLIVKSKDVFLSIFTVLRWKSFNQISLKLIRMHVDS
jgi:hypothetical protein